MPVKFVRSSKRGRLGATPFAKSSFAKRLRVEELEDRRMLAVFTVDNVNDSGPGSLRDAIAMANATAGVPDEIVFDPAVFTGGTNSLIRLTSGELQITDTLTIDGTTGTDVVITADADGDDALVAGTYISDVGASFGGVAGAEDDLLDDNSRVLNISAATGDLTLSGLTITGGRTTGDNAFSDTTHSGGGIRFLSDGTLTFNNSNVSGNSTAGFSADGGGIYTCVGDVILTSSTLNGNGTAGVFAAGGGYLRFPVT